MSGPRHAAPDELLHAAGLARLHAAVLAYSLARDRTTPRSIRPRPVGPTGRPRKDRA